MCIDLLLESSIKSFEIRNIRKWSEIAVIIPEQNAHHYLGDNLC